MVTSLAQLLLLGAALCYALKYQTYGWKKGRIHRTLWSGCVPSCRFVRVSKSAKPV